MGTFSNVQPSAQDLQTFEIDHAGRVYLADESEPSPRFLIKIERKTSKFFKAIIISLCRIFFIWVHSTERSLALSAYKR